MKFKHKEQANKRREASAKSLDAMAANAECLADRCRALVKESAAISETSKSAKDTAAKIGLLVENGKAARSHKASMAAMRAKLNLAKKEIWTPRTKVVEQQTKECQKSIEAHFADLRKSKTLLSIPTKFEGTLRKAQSRSAACDTKLRHLKTEEGVLDQWLRDLK